jgi:hypothetical protein
MKHRNLPLVHCDTCIALRGERRQYMSEKGAEHATCQGLRGVEHRCAGYLGRKR